MARGSLCAQRAQSHAKRAQRALRAPLPCFLLYTAVKIGMYIQLDMANGWRVLVSGSCARSTHNRARSVRSELWEHCCRVSCFIHIIGFIHHLSTLLRRCFFSLLSYSVTRLREYIQCCMCCTGFLKNDSTAEKRREEEAFALASIAHYCFVKTNLNCGHHRWILGGWLL